MRAMLTRRGLRPLTQVGQRIDRLRVRARRRLADPHLEVEVGPIALPRAAHLPDRLTGVDPITELDRRRLEHVHVDEAAVLRRAVYDDEVPAAARVRIGVLPPVDHNAVVHGDLGPAGLGKDVLTLVEVFGAWSAEVSDGVAEVVRPDDGEDEAAGKSGRRPGVDSEERR